LSLTPPPHCPPKHTHTHRELLPAKLQSGGFDWVAVTSPEAATVYLEGWRAAGSPQVGQQHQQQQKQQQQQ